MASILGLESNISVISLPFYYFLSVVPHGVAISVASGGEPKKWDNRNPRASGMKDSLRKRLGDEAYAKYERAEAAHYNTLESIPVVFAAVTLGNLARLPKADLNNFVLAQFILRALYQYVYIKTGTPGPITFLRTAIWYAQIAWGLRVLWRAGVALI